MVEIPEPLPEPLRAPPQLVVDPRADHQLVLDTLLMGLDLCSPAKPMGAPVRLFLAGEISQAALTATLVQHGQEACQLPAQMLLGKVASDLAVSKAFAHGAYILIAGAAMLRADPKFCEVARAAGMQLLAVVAQLGGPVAKLGEALVQAGQDKRATLTTETSPRRNAPCACGSGKKHKLCCGA